MRDTRIRWTRLTLDRLEDANVYPCNATAEELVRRLQGQLPTPVVLQPGSGLTYRFMMVPVFLRIRDNLAWGVNGDGRIILHVTQRRTSFEVDPRLGPGAIMDQVGAGLAQQAGDVPGMMLEAECLAHFYHRLYLTWEEMREEDVAALDW